MSEIQDGTIVLVTRAVREEIQHRNTELSKAVEKLLRFVPESWPPKGMQRASGLTRQEARECPFFSEVALYALLGKDDARTLLALMRPVWNAVGIPRDEQP